ncbi:hypothetical protein BDV93DRAFT_610801 [Ceratobasidium sp. AG-I]|nr:hypothetical protein BDV93DRAFT_610801 [Ceratobasidium sp. AG-I]
MELILCLPPEIIASIICRLGCMDIRACRLVCRAFQNTIDHTPDIAWILELGKAGYAEPPWPRDDLTLNEKFTIFRQYVRRTHYWDVYFINDVYPSKLWMIPRGNTNIATWAADGVFAQWSESSSPDSEYLRENHNPSHHFRLDVVQAPSGNRGTGWEHWSLLEPNLALTDFALSPSRDLLVLVEAAVDRYDSRPGIATMGFTQFAVHLRTLMTNDPHPDAVQPVLYINLPLGELLVYLGFKFVGDLLAINVRLETRNSRSRLFIWNWKSGALLVDHDSAVFGGPPSDACYAFLSEELIAIPRMDDAAFRHSSGLTESALASIDIFHLDAKSGARELRPLKLVKTLDLPVTPSPSTFHPRSRWDSISVRTFSTPLTAETSGCQKFNCRCGWHKTFDLMDEYRVLCITFDVWAGGFGGAVFYIPFKTLLDHAAVMNGENRPVGGSIPWSEWAQGVSWLRGQVFEGGSGAQHVYSRVGELWSYGNCKIYIHNLNPLSVKVANIEGIQNWISGQSLSIRGLNEGTTYSDAFTLEVSQRANAPILEVCIEYGDLRHALADNRMSSVMIFEDSIMLLKRSTDRDWKFEDGIALLTE